MKAFVHWFGSLMLLISFSAVAQDAAVEEKLNRLSAQFEDIIAAQRAQQKQLSELAREIESLRSQVNKPEVAYATTEDLKRLAEALREIDRKRIEDNEKIEKQLMDLAKTLSSASSRRREIPDTPAPSRPERGYEYVIQPGDTLSVVVQAYREKGVKVTVDQVLKANPNVKANSLRVGQKIFIPEP